MGRQKSLGKTGSIIWNTDADTLVYLTVEVWSIRRANWEAAWAQYFNKKSGLE